MSVRSENKEWGRRASPSYVKVRDWLLDYIAERRLGPGDRVPSERVLAESLSLSRPTIARAILELVEQKVLTREQGNGTFVASPSARRLSEATGSVGMLIPFSKHDPSGEAPDPDERLLGENVSDQTIHGVLSVLKDSGCRLVVHHTSSAQEEADVLASIANEGLHGAIVLSLATPEMAKSYAKLVYTGPPIVFVDRYFPSVPIDRVVTDNVGGAREGVKHLISRGRRRIAYFTNFAEVTSIVDREAGYRAAIEEAGLACDEDIICGPEIARYGRLSFEHSLHYCLSLPEPIDAVFCLNDDMVWAAIHAAHKLGLSIPQELEVSGFFDSSTPKSILGPVTRVVQAKFRIGQIAAQLLLERMRGDGSAEPRHILVSPDLIPAMPEEPFAVREPAPAGRR